MTVVSIRFGVPRSKLFPRVSFLASQLPSYKSEPGQYSIEETVTASNWRTIFTIWKLAYAWKSCHAEIDGVEAGYNDMAEIQSVFQCHNDREKSGKGDEHCLDSPDGYEPRYMGCRFSRGVRMYECDDSRYQSPEWWRFGMLSPDLGSFLVDKEEILKRVRLQNVSSIGRICPAWSPARIEAVVKGLPVSLKIGEDWKLRYSGVTGLAVGVEPKWPMNLKDFNALENDR